LMVMTAIPLSMENWTKSLIFVGSLVLNC